MIEVQAPDGTIIEFPAGTDNATIERVMRETYKPDDKPIPREGQKATLGHKIGALTEGVAQGLTFGFSDEIAAGLGTGFGYLGDYDKALKEERDRMAENQRLAGGYRLGGELAGGLAGGAGLAKGGLTLAGRAAGKGLGARVGAGIAEGAAYGGAYGAGTADGGAKDRLAGAAGGAAFGGLAGGAIPVVGAGIRGGFNAAGNTIGRRVGGVRNPSRESARRVGEAVNRDKAMQQSVLSQADEAIGKNVDIRNFDRGGETTRALTRSATNQSPESRGVIERVISDRFEGQGSRAQGLISRLVGGNTDDVALQEGLRSAARRANAPAYQKALNSPQAQGMWDEGFEQLMQSRSVQQAAEQAASRGTDRAATGGFQAIRNPFNFDEAGQFTLKVNKDGSRAIPNLAFWDQVKRNIDDMIGAAQRLNERSRVSDLMEIKTALVSKLDDAVPEYRIARAGAAAFFGADDALEAGRKYATQSRNLRQAANAIMKMKPAEREAFKTGFAGELIERISKTSDRRNVINQMFGNESMRSKMTQVFGKQGAKEVEAFVKLETALDMARNAVQGNSTTARQLAEMGLAGAGGWYATGDISGGITAAALAKGARMAGAKAEERVLREVAKILLSKDRSMLERGVKMVAQSQASRQAIDDIMIYLENAARLPIAQQAPALAN